MSSHSMNGENIFRHTEEFSTPRSLSDGFKLFWGEQKNPVLPHSG